MPEPERTGAESRDRSSRRKRRVVDLGAVKRLQPVAGWIVKRNQAADAPGIGQRLWLGGDRHAGFFQPRRQRIQRRAVGDLPAEEARTISQGAVDHDALLAVVHPACQQRVAALDRLQSDQAGPELPPVLAVISSEAGISQTQQCHRLPPSIAIFAHWMRRCLLKSYASFPRSDTPRWGRKGLPGRSSPLTSSAADVIRLP